MALKLTRESKGISAEYNKIIKNNYDAIEGHTTGELALYVSQETRNEDITNFLESESFSFPGECSVADSYTNLKASKMETREITPAVIDPDTQEVTTPAVTEEVETNPFASAIDC